MDGANSSSSLAVWFIRLTRGWRVHLWVGLFFTVLTLVMTYPLVLNMADSVVGDIGDNIYFVFLIRWYQKAWFELGISPFFHPWLNFPQGWNLASTDTSLATTLFGLLGGVLAGPTFGYNFAMLVTFVLSGWAMFFWVRRLTGSGAAGLVAGTIYAFLPDRMAHFLIGHLNLSGTEWFPLYFMGLYDLLRKKGGWGSTGAHRRLAWLDRFYLHVLPVYDCDRLAGVRRGLLLVCRAAGIGDPVLWKRLAVTGAARCRWCCCRCGLLSA